MRLRALLAVPAAVLLSLGPAPGASAHEERDSVFPPGTGKVPTYRTQAQAADVLVVCKPDSARRIAAIRDAKLRAQNQRLLKSCRYRHIQAAVDAVKKQRTNIYVLPGVYREEPSWDPPCTKDYEGGAVSYDLMVRCGEVVNLVTITGDSPTDPDITCDGPRCQLQIEGTGQRKSDVVLRGGFRPNGDWVKHNGIKADRADGFYLRNMTAELFRENAVYVHETDGYVIDRVDAHHNDLYGILTFTSDHGLIQDCETSYNGDSGVYPGSAADVNASSTTTGKLSRWAVEIRRCNTHHNALGFSGTAGNSVWFHDNLVHHNGAGYVTDSFVGGHPGMPQDHAVLTSNQIFSNNSNYYEKYVHSGVCARKPAEVGYGKGVVCPAFPVPVGTGVLIAGGNYNLISENRIYDNWRNGVMLFWVPGAVRGDFDAPMQVDTSNGNHMVRNSLGRHPAGLVQPNGIDFWWDEQGRGNCWSGNTSASGKVTHNVLLPTGLPDCAGGGSLSPVGNAVKTATLVPCSQYNREDNPDPDGCDWFDTPPAPEGRETAPGDAAEAQLADAQVAAVTAPVALERASRSERRSLAATGPAVAVPLVGLAAVVAGLALRRRRVVA